MAKHSSDEGKKGAIDNYINVGLHAFLISDPSDSVDASSSMVGATAMEIPEGNGYARKPVILPPATIRIATDGSGERIATSLAPQQQWSAAGDVPSFDKICYARGATSIRGATSGTLIRVEHANQDVNGNPVAVVLVSGQSYRHTAVFEVEGIVI